jgi:hypothetical protein
LDIERTQDKLCLYGECNHPCIVNNISNDPTAHLKMFLECFSSF